MTDELHVHLTLASTSKHPHPLVLLPLSATTHAHLPSTLSASTKTRFLWCCSLRHRYFCIVAVPALPPANLTLNSHFKNMNQLSNGSAFGKLIPMLSSQGVQLLVKRVARDERLPTNVIQNHPQILHVYGAQ